MHSKEPQVPSPVSPQVPPSDEHKMCKDQEWYLIFKMCRIFIELFMLLVLEIGYIAGIILRGVKDLVLSPIRCSPIKSVVPPTGYSAPSLMLRP